MGVIPPGLLGWQSEISDDLHHDQMTTHCCHNTLCLTIYCFIWLRLKLHQYPTCSSWAMILEAKPKSSAVNVGVNPPALLFWQSEILDDLHHDQMTADCCHNSLCLKIYCFILTETETTSISSLQFLGSVVCQHGSCTADREAYQYHFVLLVSMSCLPAWQSLIWIWMSLSKIGTSQDIQC